MQSGFSVVLVLVVAAGIAGISGCGGGGSDSPAAPPSDAATRDALIATNVSSQGFPWSNAQPGVLKRWQLPIPVKTNGEPRAIQAMNTIESRLGVTVFDRTSIAVIADGSITRGLIISQGTAFVPPGTPPQNACGGVSGVPNDGAYPSPFLVGAEISARLYINLDSAGCVASLDVTIHEFGHALGMGPHYAGFGEGAAISELFWRVLKTIYANPIATPTASIVLAP